MKLACEAIACRAVDIMVCPVIEFDYSMQLEAMASCGLFCAIFLS